MSLRFLANFYLRAFRARMSLIWGRGRVRTHQHREHPRVPGYAEIDRNDPAALIEARHQEARDKWVAIMGTRLLREQLRECYMREGTNHLKNCRELAQEYVHRIKDASNAYQTWDKQVRAVCPSNGPPAGRAFLCTEAFCWRTRSLAVLHAALLSQPHPTGFSRIERLLTHRNPNRRGFSPITWVRVGTLSSQNHPSQ